jgi:hypothetical protein
MIVKHDCICGDRVVHDVVWSGVGTILFAWYNLRCHFGFSRDAKLKISRLQHLCRGEW